MGEGATIKRLLREQGRVVLMPENPEFKPFVVSDAQELQILGVVRGVVRVC